MLEMRWLLWDLNVVPGTLLLDTTGLVQIMSPPQGWLPWRDRLIYRPWMQRRMERMGPGHAAWGWLPSPGL